MQLNHLHVLAMTAAIIGSGLLVGCSGDKQASASRTDASAAQSTDAAAANETADEEAARRRKIERLVAQLKSKNKPLNPLRQRLTPKPRDRKGYSEKAQEKVDAAQRELAALGKDAFPVLIEHLDDQEYSQTFITSLLQDFSVGQVCFMLIESQVHLTGTGYGARVGADGESHAYPRYFAQYCGKDWYTQEGVRLWWSEHRHLSLREMQIEALEWAIAQERTIGFVDAADEERVLAPSLSMLEKLKNNEPLVPASPVP